MCVFRNFLSLFAVWFGLVPFLNDVGLILKTTRDSSRLYCILKQTRFKIDIYLTCKYKLAYWLIYYRKWIFDVSLTSIITFTVKLCIQNRHNVLSRLFFSYNFFVLIQSIQENNYFLPLMSEILHFT